jgi:hypothetical protein
VPLEAIKSTASARAWLLGRMNRLVETGESHLVLKSFEQEVGISVDEPSALVFGVLHTISHVLKATAHRYVGTDADSLAEYLFPAHTAGLLYVSSHVEFTLGGIDSVFRGNLTQWLGSARDYAGRCSFDPVCARSGGACSACLYPKFGCGILIALSAVPSYSADTSRGALYLLRAFGPRVLWQPPTDCARAPLRVSSVAGPKATSPLYCT